MKLGNTNMPTCVLWRQVALVVGGVSLTYCVVKLSLMTNLAGLGEHTQNCTFPSKLS
jgi:hypothetical protein